MAAIPDGRLVTMAARALPLREAYKVASRQTCIQAGEATYRGLKPTNETEAPALLRRRAHRLPPCCADASALLTASGMNGDACAAAKSGIAGLRLPCIYA